MRIHLPRLWEALSSTSCCMTLFVLGVCLYQRSFIYKLHVWNETSLLYFVANALSDSERLASAKSPQQQTDQHLTTSPVKLKLW